MPGIAERPIYYRLRLRTADNTADAFVATSVRGGANPYLSTAPRGDGSSFDPLTCDSMLGAYTGQIADWSIGGAQRVLTAQLEDGTTFRQQLGYRRAFVEWSYDGVDWSSGVNGGVLIAGYLTLLRLVSAIEFEYTVSDPMSAQVVTQLFSPTSKTNIVDFLATWPQRGCLLGGPIMAPIVSGKYSKVLGIWDLGGWTMKVETTSLAGQYLLRPVWAYGPPNWISSVQISQDLADAINNAIAPLQTSFSDGSQSAWTTIDDAQTHYWAWAGVTTLIDAQDGHGFQPWKPLPYDYQSVADDAGNLKPATLVSPSKGNNGAGPGLKVISDGTKTLTNGATVRVRVITVLPTESCPIYLTGHPIDLLTTFWTATGLSYDVAACAALKAAWSGLPTQMNFRITEPKSLSDLVQAICKPLGLGIRGNDAGELQPFIGRAMSATAPVVTVTTADVVDRSTSLPFELDPSKAVQTLTLEQKIFADQRNTPLGTRGSIVDGVVPVDDSATFVNGDTSAVPFGQFDISTDAQMSFSSASAPTLAQFGSTIAGVFFDRFGHGGVAFETTLLRGGVGDTLKLGDQALVDHPALPNHNYRLGDNAAIAARAMQIVRRTVLPSGYAVRFADSGPNAQPLATVPVLTIALSSDAPRTVALVTITNAATLNGLGYGARLQAAISTDGTVPAASAYADVQAWKSGQIPTTAVRLPAVTAGATVYVQARSEGVATARPSNYGAVVSVALSSVADPTGLTATSVSTDGSQALLAWTPGANTAADFVDVWIRASGTTFSAASKVITLNAGSVQYTLDRLVIGSSYTASIQYRDPKTQDESDLVEVTFTASGALVALDPPTDPTGFSGSQDPIYGLPRNDGSYGLAVAASEFPGFTEFTEEVETRPNSGVYGAPTTVATIPNVQGNWTIYENIAPNDGLRRQLAARHVRDGATASAYTTGVVVTPWTSLPLGLFSQVVGSGSILRVSFTKSSDGLSMVYTVTVGKSVTAVYVHTRTVSIDVVGDPFDFSGNETVTVEPGLDILRPDENDQVTFSVALPPREFEVAGRMVPVAGAKEGTSVPFTVFAAPQAINANIAVARETPTTADLSIPVSLGPSDVPATIQLYERIDTVETLLLTKTISVAGTTTIDKTTDPVLGGRALPASTDVILWRDVVTDVSGQPWDFGPTTATRSPLPAGTVSVGNYRSNPVLILAFSPSVTEIVYTAHSGKTKTWSGAALATSPVTYELGVTPLDDSSLETALTVDQSLSGATVAYTGGGSTVQMWAADLHGQPSNPPTVKVSAIPNAAAGVESVSLVPDTQVSEQLYLFYRFGADDTAPQWQLCNSATDRTARAIVAGTVIGSADYFARTDGTGSPTTILNNIPVGRDTVTRHATMAQGKDSGIQSDWIPVVLSLLQQPWLESFTAEWDAANQRIIARLRGGAFCASVAVEASSASDFSVSPSTQTSALADGADLILYFPLSAAQLGKVWYLGATPWNQTGESGLDGAQQTYQVAVPASWTAIGTPAESSNQGTVTLAVTDAGSLFKPTAVDGTVTAAVSWHRTVNGVTTIEDSTTKPGVGTTGNYVKTIALDPAHPTTLVAIGHFIDGSSQTLGTWTFDWDKLSDLVGNSVANNGATANVSLKWDTDTLIGTACARYSLDGGVTWTTITVASDLTSSIAGVARTSSPQTMIVQGKNALDGNWGNQYNVTIDAYLSEGPTWKVQKLANTPDSSHDEIVWSCTQGTALVSINGGALATPAASPITVAKPATGAITYVFQFTNGGLSPTQEVDILPMSADTVDPNLDVALGVAMTISQPVTVTASNPVSGGPVPTITVKCVACTMTIGGTTYPDGTTQTITSGTVVTGNRLASTTATVGQLEIVATLGTATERIVVPVIPQASAGIPQGTISIDSNGNASFSVDCPANTQSIKWQTSGLGYPADATVASIGNLITGGRSFTQTNYVTLGFGNTSYVTIVPFDGPSGTGNQLPTIHIQGAYLTYSASKTANYAPGAWSETDTSSQFGRFKDANGNALCGESTSGTPDQFFSMTTLLPSGTTSTGIELTQIAVDIWSPNNVGTPTSISYQFNRKTGSGAATSLGGRTATFGAGWQTLTVSLAEFAQGNGYEAIVDFVLNTGSAGQGGVGNVAITYTSADPKQTL